MDAMLPPPETLYPILWIGIILGVITQVWMERDDILAALRRLADRYVSRRYVTSDDVDNSDDAISRHQDAVKENAENAENGKPLGPTPAELDRMIAQARYEALARAVGILAGRGIIPAERRSAALLAVGIEGRRYTSLKPLVDAAQAAAQAEQPPLPPEPARIIRVTQRRPASAIAMDEEVGYLPPDTSVADPGPPEPLSS